MAVITPLQVRPAAEASLDLWRPRHGVRLPRHWCSAASLLADCVGIGLCVAGIGFLSDVIGARAFTPDAGVDIQLHGVAGSTLVLLVAVIVWLARRSHYTRRIPFWSQLGDVSSASILALMCDGFVQASLAADDHRVLTVLTWALVPPVLMLSRLGCRQILARFGMWELRTVVVGSGDAMRQAERALLSEPALGYRVAGRINPARLDGFVETLRWRDLLHRYDAQMLVLALPSAGTGTRRITESLVRERVPFAVMPRPEGLPILGFEQTRFFSHDTVMFTYRNNLAQPVARAIKIGFDLAAATLMLIIMSPLLVLLVAAVKLDGGPALFAHQRIGAGGRTFACLKFRSMVVDADAVLSRLLSSDQAAAEEWAETQKLRRDPRVTWIGRILRSTSLDELPQLFNVLRLEMSLVGPRPIVADEVERYAEDIAYYYETRPGVTGLWQVSGRSDTGYEQRVQLDTWYVKNWTLWHDLAILVKTVPAVLQRRGAV